MKRLLLCLLIGFLLGCAAEHESIGKLSRDSQSGAEKFSESETQNVLIFNESSAFVSESEGSWNLRVSSFEPVQAIYVDNIPMTLAGGSYDFFFEIPYKLNSEEKSFNIEVYTTQGVIKREVLLKQKTS
ncbi:MAG: hypothetical protein VXY74_10755 [SAR324 cluster bacterium]|nr:hypothetical protein [SAR324 cluster bacterium]